jgi:hypothetical protein
VSPRQEAAILNTLAPSIDWEHIHPHLGYTDTLEFKAKERISYVVNSRTSDCLDE